MSNKSTLGLPSFIKSFYQDCKDGNATGWWNERYNRKAERVGVKLEDVLLNTPYDIINYIKDYHESLTQDDVDYIADSAYRAYPLLAKKRSYYWEVEDKEVISEETVEETPEEDEAPAEPEKETPEEETTEEKEAPDFDYAKTIEDKQELKKYAKGFGFKIDSRKSLGDMMKSFQGKYHASKNK